MISAPSPAAIERLKSSSDAFAFAVRRTWNPRLESCKPSMLNALRRTLLNDVPSMAIDYTCIEVNKSVSSDFFICTQLTHLPLLCDRATLDRMSFNAECSCHSAPGCDNCCVALKLDVKNNSPRFLTDWVTVYADDLKIQRPNVVQLGQSGIPLWRLGVGHHVKLVCYARKGTPSMHQRWVRARVALKPQEGEMSVHATCAQVSSSELVIQGFDTLMARLQYLEAIVFAELERLTSCLSAQQTTTGTTTSNTKNIADKSFY